MKSIHPSALFYVLLTSLSLIGCASAPQVNDESILQSEAEDWFAHYCAEPTLVKIGGDLAIKSNTKEFKGQFPASVLFEKNNQFLIEITNILGGTVAQLKGDSKTMSIRVPGKPKYDRDNVTHYLGLEMSVLLPLLRGELPCPAEARSKNLAVQVEGNAIKVRSSNWDWYYYRSTEEQGLVPVRVTLKSGGQTIEMNVEDWNEEEQFLKKGRVSSPEGELKWTWRSRTKS